MVDPRVMCRKHLLGEHVETHMFFSSIAMGKELRGYVEKGLLEVSSLKLRHDALAKEMLRRGYRHSSPMGPLPSNLVEDRAIDPKASLRDLLERCPLCQQRFVEEMGDVALRNVLEDL